MWESTNGMDLCGINKKISIKSSNLEIMSYGFPKEKKHIWANSKKDGLVHSSIVLVFVNNFEPNIILVNVNKLKPYTCGSNIEEDS
jgi:hypothetical protein